MPFQGKKTHTVRDSHKMTLEHVISTQLSRALRLCDIIIWLGRVRRHMDDVVACPTLWMQHRGSVEVSLSISKARVSVEA